MKPTKEHQNIMESAGKKRMLKLATYMPRLYNKLCPHCKLLVVRLTKRGKSSMIMEEIKKRCSKCETLMNKAEVNFK